MGIYPKLHVKTLLNFEHAYFEATIQYFKHYAKGIFPTPTDRVMFPGEMSEIQKEYMGISRSVMVNKQELLTIHLKITGSSILLALL